MRLVILFIQVALVKSIKEVNGYLGGSVTLPSEGISSWDLSTIKWSIFPNNTWIATYQNKKENTERIPQYKGRLSLNITSGDLTIHNLTSDDAMEYTVDLINTEKRSIVNKIKLTVRQHLPKPTIDTLFNVSAKGGCLIWLQCISADEGVAFSWRVQPPSVTPFILSNPDGNPGLLSALLNSTQIHVQFTCISTKNIETTSSVVTHKCDVADEKPPQHPHHCRDRCGLCVFSGLVVGVLGIVIIYCCREQIKAAWEYLKGKMCPSINTRI